MGDRISRVLGVLTGTAAAALVAVTLTACGSKDNENKKDALPSVTNLPVVPATPPSPTSTTGTTAPPRPGSTTVAPPQLQESTRGPASNVAGRVEQCDANDLAAKVIRQPRAGPAHVALLTLTNQLSRPCSVKGWATIALTDATGGTTRLRAVPVSEPREPVTVVLTPTRTAFAGLTWVSCRAAESGCQVGNTLRVTPPGNTQTAPTRLIGFPAPAAGGLAMRAARVGPLQQTPAGVVDW